MSLRPDKIIRDRIEDQIAGLIVGENLFSGRYQGVGGNIPATAVFVIPSGGPADSPNNGEAVSIRFPAVQIRVRSEAAGPDGGGGTAGGYDQGIELAQDIREAVRFFRPAGVIDMRLGESAPIPLPDDDHGNHEWSINIDVTLEE